MSEPNVPDIPIVPADVSNDELVTMVKRLTVERNWAVHQKQAAHALVCALQEELLQAQAASRRQADLYRMARRQLARAHQQVREAFDDIYEQTTRRKVAEERLASLAGVAVAWVERITSHPNQWGDTPDMDLIRVVRRLRPDVRCPWLSRPEYAGWTDSTDPGSDAP
jgi:hypothetical protein